MAKKPTKKVPREVEVYGEDLISALGLMTIRAGHLDDMLAFALSAIVDTTPQMGMALFYSTRSASARTDMIQAALSRSKLSKGLKDAAKSLINRAEGLAKRRNALVHGQFMMTMKGNKEPQRTLINHDSAKAEDYKVRPINGKEIQVLADEYKDLRNELWDIYMDAAWRAKGVRGPIVVQTKNPSD